MSIIGDILKIRHIAAKLDVADAVKSVAIGPDAEVEMIASTRAMDGVLDLQSGGVKKFMGLGVNIDPRRTTVCVEFIEDRRSQCIRRAFEEAGFEARAI